MRTLRFFTGEHGKDLSASEPTRILLHHAARTRRDATGTDFCILSIQCCRGLTAFQFSASYPVDRARPVARQWLVHVYRHPTLCLFSSWPCGWSWKSPDALGCPDLLCHCLLGLNHCVARPEARIDHAADAWGSAARTTAPG